MTTQFKYMKFIKMNRLLSLIPRNYCNQCPNACNKLAAKNLKRHNYHEKIESGVNEQILHELNASMTYLSMCCFYGRNEVALPGCQHFFKQMYLEEQQHAMEFMDYQLLRGGNVKLFPLTVPENQDYGCITVALGMALELEIQIKEKLKDLLCLAGEHDDVHLVDLLSSKCIPEQNESINTFARYLTQAEKMVDSGHVGEFLFDKELYKLYFNNEEPYSRPAKIHNDQ